MGQAEMTECAAGFYCPVDGLVEAEPCWPGTFNDQTGEVPARRV